MSKSKRSTPAVQTSHRNQGNSGNCDREPQQVVRIALPMKLVAALDHMRHKYDGEFLLERTLPDFIRRALKYAAWKWSHGAGPKEEMGPSLKWDERIPDDWALDAEAARFASTPAELERLLGRDDSQPPAPVQP